MNEGGGAGGNRDRRDSHPSLLWSDYVRYEAYGIYDTPNMCFPDTKTKKSKTTTTMTTDNVDCDHDTVREGVKSWMQSAWYTAASASSLSSHHFLVKISGHALLLWRLLSSSCNGDKIITATLIPILPLLRVSQSLLYFQKRCRSKHDSTRLILSNTVVFVSSNGIEGLLSPKSGLYNFSHAAVLLGYLILRGVILSLCHRSSVREGGGGGMNAALADGWTVLHIVNVSFLDSFSSSVGYVDSYDAH